MRCMSTHWVDSARFSLPLLLMVRPRNPWKPAEDDILRVEVLKHANDWKKISEALPGRDRNACMQRWRYRLMPEIDHTPFTKEEDLTILRLVPIVGTNWAEIAKSIPRRTLSEIANQWHNTLKKKEKEKEVAETLLGIGPEGHVPTAAAPEAQTVIKGHAPASDGVADVAALMQAIATELAKAASVAAKEAKAEDAVATAKEELEKVRVTANEWIAKAAAKLEESAKAAKAVAEPEGAEIVVNDDEIFHTRPTKYH